VSEFWQHAFSYWWLIFPMAGIVGGWLKGAQRWDERRRRDKIELYRLKHADKVAATEAAEATTAEIDRVIAEHEDTTKRWLDYELDTIKVLEYPVMTDMREQVTVDFHRAKRDADGLRPDDVDELRDPHKLARYREAVREFQVRFDVAEAEAKRRRASDFSTEERAALERAKRLLAMAEDSAASQSERQTAYRQATRELEGLIVLPDAATEALQQRIAGSLESGRQS